MDRSLIGLDPRVLASLLAHEAAHAQAALDGTVKAEEDACGIAAACMLDQVNAHAGQAAR